VPQQDPVLQFSVTCLDLLEPEKGPPTFQYLFYELPLPALPFRMERFYIINCWINGHGQFRQSIRIVDTTKTKKLLDTGPQEFALGDPFTPWMAINQVVEFTFAEAGSYWIQTFLNEILVREYPLTVRLTAGGVRIQPPGSDARIRRFSARLM